jgi:hypothetical protein
MKKGVCFAVWLGHAFVEDEPLILRPNNVVRFIVPDECLTL